MSVGAVNKQTGDRIPTAGMPAIDSVLSGSSTNPVQNAIITAALADKQDKTDNNLTTTDKTTTGAINELKSGFTNLDNEVNGDATTYPYADVITIEDAVPSNLADCNVKIEPVQDLHGYDHPWVGGAGKNLMPNPLNNGVVGSNGSYSSRDDRITNVTKSFDNILPIKAGTYTISADGLDSCTVLTKDASDNIVDNFANNWNNLPYTFTLTADAFLYVSLRKNNNDNISPNDYQVQVESGSTATSYEPYSNICPISGHTEASVQRDGKNRFDKNSPNIENKLFLNDGRVVGSSDWRASDFIKIDASKGYTLSGITIHPNTNTDNIRLFNEFKEDIGYSAVSTNSYPKTFPSGTKYIKFCCRNTEIDNAQFQEGVATPYVPYAGKTYTIALGDTIYGGTVDFDTGVMTVTMAEIASYDGETIGEPWISDRDVYAPGTTPTTGAQVVYTLTTPTTIQLTPQQIQLLKGQNTLTASTGQISVTVNGVSGAIGAVQEQVNATDAALAELADKLPTAPTTDGAYVLTVTVADGTPTYSWESAT